MKSKITLMQFRLFGALLLALPLTIQAQFNYGINSFGTITISSYTGSDGAVNIPETLDGLPVTEIGNGAFFNCSNMTNVSIPNNVTFIGQDAFADCTNLLNISIPNSVTNILGSAFENCFAMTNAAIGSNVSVIGDMAFSDCSSLQAIMVHSNNLFFSSVDGMLLDKSQTALVVCPGGITNCLIPGSVTNIVKYAFSFNTNLARVTLPSSLSGIGDWAFNGCFKLTRITIPIKVTTIGQSAFESCVSLTNITFQGNAPVGVGAYNAFSFINEAAFVYYLSDTTGWGVKYGGVWTVELDPPQINGSASARMNKDGFGFNVIGTVNQDVTIEASTNLMDWQTIQIINLPSISTNFTDNQWANYPNRFYRIR